MKDRQPVPVTSHVGFVVGIMVGAAGVGAAVPSPVMKYPSEEDIYGDKSISYYL